MLKFIKNAYSLFVEISLWVILIGCAVAGYFIGGALEEILGDGHPVLGLFVGLIVGGLIDIVYGGFVATIIAIEKNTGKS